MSDDLEELARHFEELGGPDQGLRYEAANGGELRYDEYTGKRYYTRSRPAELTVYGPRATFLLDVIGKHGATIAAALRAHREGE